MGIILVMDFLKWDSKSGAKTLVPRLDARRRVQEPTGRSIQSHFFQRESFTLREEK